MTKNNEQIIIDVCPYQGECSVSGCKRNDDGCFVRQLFKERYRAENQIVELNKTIKAKEQECEYLKDKLNCRFCYPIMKIDDPENFKLCQETECFRRQLDQLKQTLEEIREIAKNSKKDICNNCGWRNTDSCDPTDYTCGEFLKIIEKINEVIDVENN